jgi:hypothetical protein
MAALPEQTGKSPFTSFVKPTIEIPPFTISFEEPLSKVKKVNRCNHSGCKKKLSLTDFPCKCGLTHCSEHRPSEVHNCTYDFKANHNTYLMKTMDKAIVAKKVDKI